MKLVNPNNKRKFKVIVVGTGLAGASAAATLAELGYQVDAFTFHDSPRRAHSIAAQGGINAAKNYRGDGDSHPPSLLRHGQRWRLPLAREQRPPPGTGQRRHHRPDGGPGRAVRPRVRRVARQPVSFGGAQVSRTFYARGQTGQQLLLGAYQQLARQIGLGGVTPVQPCRARRHRGRSTAAAPASSPAT